MSARALAWAWQQTPNTATQKLVLAAIADRADDDGECFPSLKWISEKCAPTSEQTIKRCVAALAEQGLLEKTERRRRSDGTLGTWMFRLPLDEPQVTSDPWSPQVTHDLTEVSSSYEEKNTLSDESVANAKTRKRDPIWDTLTEIFGGEAAGMERGRWNAACKSLRSSGASPETIRKAAANYPQVMPPGTMMTPTAIAANWTLLTANGKTAHDLRNEDLFRRIADLDARRETYQ